MRYRLIDEYSLFYLRWITQAKSVALSGVDENFWIKMGHTPAGRAWSGYAFESLCMKHIRNVKEALGISGVSTTESTWLYKAAKDTDERGTQIDLLIDRADNCINLCEIKYTNDPFSIDKDYALNLQAKKSIFISKTNSKKSIFLTLITTYGVKEKGSGLVDIELTMNDLF